MSSSQQKLDDTHNRTVDRNMVVAIAGLGNVGSQLVALLGRAAEIGRLILIDPDAYEQHNLSGQNIHHADVGQPKVAAMAKLCAAICPEILVSQHACTIEDVPLADLRCDAMVSCVDSRRSRHAINTIASRLRVPWVDGALQAEASLARAAVYLPGADQPCLQCRCSDESYASLEAVYSCTGGAPEIPATDAPVELGAMVASMLALEVRRLLAGDLSGAGHEVYVNAEQHTMVNASFRFNQHCRFDHQALSTSASSHHNLHTTLAELRAAHHATHLSVEGHSFVFDAACPACVDIEPFGPQLTRVRGVPPCQTCGSERERVGHSIRQSLVLADWPPQLSMANIGLQSGDVIELRVSGSSPLHIELGRADAHDEGHSRVRNNAPTHTEPSA